MAWTLAALSLSVLFAAPQGEPQQDGPKLLSSSDVSALNKKAAEWFESWIKHEFMPASEPRGKRAAAARALKKDKESFLKEWESQQKKLKKGDILASLPDLRAVFANTFPYDRQSTSGQVKIVKESEESSPYGLVAPRRYDPRDAYRGIFVIPGWDDEQKDWARVEDWFEGTWNDSELNEGTIFILPQMPKALDLDSKLDPADGETVENQRLRAILTPAGQVQREYNLDRERLLLDSAKGSGAFALRLCSYFPDRFAGLILRHPVDVTKDMRLGSLAGLPILLISTKDTKDVAEDLRSKLEALQSGTTTVLEGKGAYPFKDSEAEIAAWAKDVRRKLNRSRVVVEPNSDRFNDAYWVQLGTVEPLANLPMDKQPRFVVEADRANNRINVDSRGVGDFRLLLNDEILDLSKPFTVVVNGTAIKQENERSITFLTDEIKNRFDPTWIFVTDFKKAE